MEGPSLVILRQEMKPFVGQIVRRVEGNSKIGIEELAGQKLYWIKTWGKHYLLKIGNTVLRVHFLLWGSYSLNQQKPRSSTLSLFFDNGESHFYSSSIRKLEQPVDEIYDWRVDVMSRKWDAKYVAKLVKPHPTAYVADVRLDQDIFAGVGNIIKNEVLWNLGMHPLTRVRDLKRKQITALVEEAHRYSHQFYRWKKRYVLKRNWKVYHKGTCPECGEKLTRGKMGKRDRYTFYCPTCQPKVKKRTTSTPK